MSLSKLTAAARIATYNMLQQQQLMTSTLVMTKRWKGTAAASAEAAEVEWNAAKPYDQIPGARSLPFVGTMWAAMGS
jgi:hypothetical protein